MRWQDEFSWTASGFMGAEITDGIFGASPHPWANAIAFGVISLIFGCWSARAARIANPADKIN